MAEKMLLSDSALKLLNADWRAAKASGATQEGISKSLGMQQPTFSQYLRGVIPLNVAFLLRYAQVRKVPPESVGVVKGVSTVDVDKLRIRVKSSTAGIHFEGRFIDMSGKVETTQAFAIEVDSDFRSIPKGSFLVCEELPCAKGSLVVSEKDGKTIVGTLNKYGDTWAIVQPLISGDAAVQVDKSWKLYKVTSIVFDTKDDNQEFF